MTATKRIAGLLMAVAMLFMMLAGIAYAASPSKYVKSGQAITVETGKSGWSTSPKITVKNTGTQSATILVEDSRGRAVKQCTCLKPNKDVTFTLKDNQSYTVLCSRHYTARKACNLNITSNKYVKNIY